jgi:glycosyltransferase involved in cell wall biosynthesis
MEYDAVCLQKRLLSPIEFFFLRVRSRKLLYDFDDAVFLRDIWPPQVDGNWVSLSRRFKFRTIVKHSDMVLSGNGYLAREAANYQSCTKILPSAVPVTDIPKRLDLPDNPVPIVGWIGTKGTLRYFEMIEEDLQRVARRCPFELRIVSDSHFSVAGVQCRNIEWLEETQEQEIARFDIGLMPLSDDPFSRGKCAYKLLQYMAGGVPFVASAVGMNVEVSASNTTGFVVTSSEDFESKLFRLLTNRTLRLRMGRAARELAVKRYSIEAVGAQMAAYIQEVTGRIRDADWNQSS